MLRSAAILWAFWMMPPAFGSHNGMSFTFNLVSHRGFTSLREMPAMSIVVSEGFGWSGPRKSIKFAGKFFNTIPSESWPSHIVVCWRKTHQWHKWDMTVWIFHSTHRERGEREREFRKSHRPMTVRKPLYFSYRKLKTLEWTLNLSLTCRQNFRV